MINIKDEEDWKKQNRNVSLIKDKFKKLFKISKRTSWSDIFSAYSNWKGRKPVSLCSIMREFSKQAYLMGYKNAKVWRFNDERKNNMFSDKRNR